jgi:tyrosyl-tRNA synthetase
LQAGVNVVNLVTETAIFPSKGEARKLIQNGGLSINREKITDAQLQVDSSHLLHDKYILLQKGKKNYYLVIAE